MGCEGQGLPLSSMDAEPQKPVLPHSSQEASKDSPDARSQRTGSKATNPSLARFIRHSTGECRARSFRNMLLIIAIHYSMDIPIPARGGPLQNRPTVVNSHFLGRCSPRNTFKFSTSSFISFPFGVSKHAGRFLKRSSLTIWRNPSFPILPSPMCA